MIKKIFLLNAIDLLKKVQGGKYVEGALFIDKSTGQLSFKAYTRQPRKRLVDRLIQALEHGWVKESPERIKVFVSLPKVIGLRRIKTVLDRENKEAQSAIEDWDLVENM